MKTRPATRGNPFIARSILGIAAALGAITAPDLAGQGRPGTVVVAGVVGTATYSTSGDAPLPLKRADNLAEGLILKTGPNSAVDLSLGSRAGVLRLTESTTLRLEKLAVDPALPENEVQIRLSLTEGSVVGFANKLTTVARYEIRVPNGVVAAGGKEFRIDAHGYVVLLAGTALVAYAPPGGKPASYTLKAPPAIYYTPQQGVQTAPKALVREVESQCKPKLRAR